MSYVGDMSEFGYLKYVEDVSCGNTIERRLKDGAPDWAREQFEKAKNEKRQIYEDLMSGRLKVE